MTARKSRPLTRALLTLAASFLLCAVPLPTEAREFDFTVYLGNKEIGRQTFTLNEDGKETRVRIEAAFDVKLLFFTAYRYRHTNEETWVDGCLKGMSSATSDGGEEFFVSTEREGNLLRVTNREGTENFEGCIRSYVYWDLSLLKGSKLLNSQTGKMDRVSIEDLGQQTIDVRGVPTQTVCRRIVNDEFTIVLWYDGDDWVALESTTAGGDRLYYAIR